MEEETPELTTTDPEMRQLLGLFDVPAFARRGQDLEFFLEQLERRVLRERDEMLAMVRVRLRQWARAVASPDEGYSAFTPSIAPLWERSGADPPEWGKDVAKPRRRKAIAADLVASVDRFNRRWEKFLRGLDLGAINDRIDQYNRYYVLEKECVFGSSRLASRNFVPMRPLTPEGLLGDHPLLPAAVMIP